MELIVLFIVAAAIMFFMLLGFAWIWVYDSQGRSILIPLLLTFGIVAFGCLLVFGLVLNWHWVWQYLTLLADSVVARCVSVGVLLLTFGIGFWREECKREAEWMEKIRSGND